jgi:glucosyl-3-phosphoglycerate synthase
MPTIRRATAADYPVEAFAARTASATLVVPARNEGANVAQTVMAAEVMRKLEVVDRVLVVDGGSSDETALEAELAGADVVAAADLQPGFGPVLGKGDSLWRALGAVDTDVVAFLDADLEGDIGKFVRGLVGPLVLGEGAPGGGGAVGAAGPDVQFVKGAFHRIDPDGAQPGDPFDGGRVTEMVARPLLNLWRPDLAAFYQPLGGQVAARTELLWSLPLLTGYAVEMAMLVDVVDRVGLGAVVEVDLGTLRNRPRATSALAPMAQEVLYAFASRVLPDGAVPEWSPYVRPRRDGGPPVPDPATVVERPAYREG